MPSETTSHPIRPDDETLQEIDDLLYEVARLAKSEATPREFHSELLGRAVRALAAVGGAVWVRLPGGELSLDSRVEVTSQRSIEILSTHTGHAELLSGVLATGDPRVVLPGASAGMASAGPNPTEYLLLLCPIMPAAAGIESGVLEVLQRPGGSPGTQQGYLRFLVALSELASDFHRNRHLRSLQDRSDQVGVVEGFARRVHASLDLNAVAYAIANEGRRVIGCDRVTVAVRRRRSFRISAISGLEVHDNRSNGIRRLEELTESVIAARIPLWHQDSADNLAPQIVAPLQAYLDESHARWLAILPLVGPMESPDTLPVGALIVEQFTSELCVSTVRDRVETVARQAELALSNALAHRSLPLFSILEALRRVRWFVALERLPRTLLFLGLAVAGCLTLVFVPTDFEIEGKGTLQPKWRREVFARSDGIVSDLQAEQGQRVQAGDILAVLSRSQLDFETSRVLGETQTARQRLVGIEASRLELTPQTATEREKYNLLAAEEEEVHELLLSLGRQYEILKEQREELNVRSPINGQVISWNVREILEARPVQRGQALLTVADLEGPWVLEAEIEDERIGHVLKARQESEAALDVTFLLATEPGVSYHGRIEQVALVSHAAEQTGAAATVRVTVAIDKAEISRLRPGATVIPRIHCGRRSVGFVWFHRVWETIQKRLW